MRILYKKKILKEGNYLWDQHLFYSFLERKLIIIVLYKKKDVLKDNEEFEG